MAALGEAIYSKLDSIIVPNVFSFVEKHASVRLSPNATSATRYFPLVDSPTSLVILVSLYLMTVMLGLIRIKVFNLKPMEKEPWILKIYVILHNTFLFLLSLYMAVGIALEAINLRYSVWGNAYSETQTRMAWFIYVFYVSKFAEFGDTFIMLVKRNVRQVSILHVYHHTSIAIIWWAITYDSPGGDAYFSAALNSLVHVFMYFYYLLSAIIGKNEKAKRKYLFWGKYLTQMQIFQFILNIIHALYDLNFDAPYPSWLTKFNVYYMSSLLVLFLNFYLTKYLSSAKISKKKKKN